jgi:ribonuclease HI
MKWYVVFKWRSPGVYGDWEACQLQVIGFSHASYKSYNNEEEAMRVSMGNVMLV